MAETFDLVIRGGEVMTPGGLVSADLGVKGGKLKPPSEAP